MAEREILIDAYNVMFAHGRLGPLLRRDLERARAEFLVLVAERVPAAGTVCFVVFDATREPAAPAAPEAAPRASRPNVRTVFARDSADAWIQRRIREHARPASVAVVTADREILATARAHGAGTIRVADFLQLPRPPRRRRGEPRPPEKPERESARQLEEWLRLFSGRRTEAQGKKKRGDD